MNLVEVWFGIIERQAIHRGTFSSVKRPQRQDPRLHRRLERPLPPLRLDQDRRPDPQESQPSDRLQTRATSHPPEPPAGRAATRRGAGTRRRAAARDRPHVCPHPARDGEAFSLLMSPLGRPIRMAPQRSPHAPEPGSRAASRGVGGGPEAPLPGVWGQRPRRGPGAAPREPRRDERRTTIRRPGKPRRDERRTTIRAPGNPDATRDEPQGETGDPVATRDKNQTDGTRTLQPPVPPEPR